MTPRGYLSWTQFSIWEHSPEAYRQEYILGNGKASNKYIDFGKRLADALENGEKNHDEEMEIIRSILPKPKRREFEIKTKCCGVPIFGKLDGFATKAKRIIEYKTGKYWDQRMADRSDQLTFYATCVYYRYLCLPSRITLVWIETKVDDRGIVYATGNIKEFVTERTMADVLKMSARIKRAWEGINSMYDEQIKQLT